MTYLILSNRKIGLQHLVSAQGRDFTLCGISYGWLCGDWIKFDPDAEFDGLCARCLASWMKLEGFILIGVQTKAVWRPEKPESPNERA